MRVDSGRSRVCREGVFGRRAAFTLVELLVVISIISVLAALLLPAVGKSILCARSLQCVNNERQILSGTMAYADAFHGYFPPMESNGTADAWQQKIAPYLNIRWVLLNPTPMLYRCPSQISSIRGVPANYDCMMKGDYGVNRYLCNIFNDNVTNGFGFGYLRVGQVAHATETVWVGDDSGGWQREISASDHQDPTSNIYRHEGATNFGFVDGHARGMSFGEASAKGYLRTGNWRYGWRDGLVY